MNEMFSFDTPCGAYITFHEPEEKKRLLEEGEPVVVCGQELRPETTKIVPWEK